MLICALNIPLHGEQTDKFRYNIIEKEKKNKIKTILNPL